MTFNREKHRILQPVWNNPMHWLKPQQAAAHKNMPVMLQGTPHCRGEPSLWTEQIAHWTAPGGAWQQTKEASAEAAQGDPQFKRDAEEMEKLQPRCLTHIHYVEMLKELGVIILVKKKPKQQLFEGPFFGHHHQTPLGNVRQHNKENNHTKPFQRLKQDSWKNIFPSSTGIRCQTGWETLSLERFIQTKQ